MRNPLNQTITEIKPSGIRKFFDIVAEMPEAISLGVGEPDFDTPWKVRDEAIYSLERGRTFYTSNSGLKELRVEIADFLKRHYGLEYNPLTEMLMTVGGSEGIDIALRAMLDPGDEVLIPQPCYVSYEPCTILAGGVPVPIALKEENEFRLKPDELEAAITDKTKILIMPFPNNPTGAVMEKADLEPIVELVKKYDLFVLTDEIYGELTYTGEGHVSIASFPGMKERTIYINGFSKSHAMTGWRLGYVAAPEPIISQVFKIHQYGIMCSPYISQNAAVEALTSCESEVRKMVEEYNVRRRYLVGEFNRLGLPCFEPEGAFYVFPCIKSTGLTSEEFCERLLYEERVAAVPGSAFGESGEGYMRISYAYSLKHLMEAIGRIEKFLKKLEAEKNG